LTIGLQPPAAFGSLLPIKFGRLPVPFTGAAVLVRIAESRCAQPLVESGHAVMSRG
jgi:hypothetical protein